MKDIILTLLSAVLSVVIPVATAYLVSFLKKKSAQVSAQTENEKAKQYIDEFTDAITTAVAATSQTYVDALKADNVFTAEAQEIALEKAKSTAIKILSTAALSFISELKGNTDEYLTVKIEGAVRNQKKEEPLLLGACISATETDEVTEE